MRLTRLSYQTRQGLFASRASHTLSSSVSKIYLVLSRLIQIMIWPNGFGLTSKMIH